MSSLPKKTGIIMWLLVVIYYLYQYLLRVSPSVMGEELMADFSIDADGFGTLSAIATFCYALLQIPGGILSDLFGVRRMVLVSLAFCTGGVLLFSLTDSLYMAYIARIFIGAGSACAFLCASKVASDWFSIEKKSLMFGLTVTAGTLGALLGGKPLALLNASLGWRGSFYLLAAVGVFLLLLNFFFLKDRPFISKGSDSIPPNRTQTWQAIREVFMNRGCWMYASVAVGIYLSISVFADLWGVSFLMLKYNLAKEEAAQAISVIYVGTCLGVIMMGALSNLLREYRHLIISGSALTMGSLLIFLIFNPFSSISLVYLLLFSIGFAAGGEILCFTCAGEKMPPAVIGTVTGFINFVVTMAAAIIQKQIGYFLNLLWDGTTSPLGLPIYSLANYQQAMCLVISFAFGSFILSFFLNRSKGWVSSFS